MQKEQNQPPPPSSVRSRIGRSDLTLLALDAAIALDRLIAAEHADKAPITHLIEALPSLNRLGHERSSACLLADPRDVSVLARAVEETRRHDLSTIEDLHREIGGFVEIYQNYESGDDKANLSAFRDFCLSLHHTLIAEAMRSRNTREHSSTFIID